MKVRGGEVGKEKKNFFFNLLNNISYKLDLKSQILHEFFYNSLMCWPLLHSHALSLINFWQKDTHPFPFPSLCDAIYDCSLLKIKNLRKIQLTFLWLLIQILFAHYFNWNTTIIPFRSSKFKIIVVYMCFSFYIISGLIRFI